MADKRKIDQSVIDEIIDSVENVDFGEVLIVVHDSKVVQIEKKVKKRLN